MRRQRKENLEKHVEEVNRLVKQANGDVSSAEESDEEAEWDGIPDAPANNLEAISQEDEYVEEDKYTTVTIESVNISKHGFEKQNEKEQDNAGGEDGKKSKVQMQERPKKKKKKIKFRYETKADRKAERVKQAVKKKKLAAKRAS